ncbi:hypothetical protein [Sorangium sp. So ce385]|uniref:hypothetical protein n=1 Tax=Sorangium sp. So ce385 TaxID=3133308 RepID=UPI003F5CA3C9
MKPADKVIEELERYGLLDRATRVAGSLPLAQAFGASGAAAVAARAAVLRAVHLADPLRWTAAELAVLIGSHVSWVNRLLARGRGLVAVHLVVPGELAWTRCGRLEPELGRGVAVDVQWATEVTCPACADAWRTGALHARGVVHVAESGAARTRCGEIVGPGIRAVSPLWRAVVSCDACRSGGPS